MGEFEVYVAKEDFKFNCSHFIAFHGFRERLHGHNYTAAVRLTGLDEVNRDGYLIDFGDIKKIMRDICRSLNEHFLCPMNSDALTICENDGQICLECEDGSKFSFPRQDCKLLPLIHSSAEELAHYIWQEFVRYCVWMSVFSSCCLTR